jgi:hypothetical protein
MYVNDLSVGIDGYFHISLQEKEIYFSVLFLIGFLSSCSLKNF